MRILQIVHDFLPRHVAGVEVYTDRLARGLAAEHEVALLFSEAVPEAENYALRRGRHGDIATFEVVNNHAFANFEETYRNDAIDARVREVLDEFRPDVVHVQHLINLSLGALDEIRRRGIPVVMTLHEHWLACANGGQRLHRELGRCDVLDASRCGACTASMAGRTPRGSGLLQRLRSVASIEPVAPNDGDLALREPLRTQLPDPRFVYRDRYLQGGALRPTWVAHPPARIEFGIAAGSGARFRAHVAMHPDTFEAPGGAVRFSVFADGRPLGSVLLDPKRRFADREARALDVALPAGARRLELRTDAEPSHDFAYCTAGWIEPRLEGASARGGRMRPLARAAARLHGALETHLAAGEAQRVRRRWAAARSAARHVDLFLSPSRHLMHEMIAFGLPADRVIHCDYGFPVDAFPRRGDLPQFARHFAFVGSLMWHKGMHVLLAAFDEMPPDARLSVAGSPSYDSHYVSLLEQLARHPGVRFVGAVSPDGVPAFLADVDALVVPSIWNENSPLTIHEAFLAGVPVVASRMGGSTELVEAGGGLLYDADDPIALREQLRRLYTESGLARRLATSSPPVKSMKDHVAELVGIYERLRGERGGRARAGA